mgnify:CR=1 FL=1
MEKGPGCRIFLAIIFGLILASFVIPQTQCGNTQGMAPEGANRGAVIAKVGSASVYAADVDESYSNQRNNYIQQLGYLPPTMEVNAIASATFNAVEQALLIEMCNRFKINLDDDKLRKVIDQSFEDYVMQTRMQLIAQGKLKPESTEADFDKAFAEANGGRSRADMKKLQDENIDKMLKDPAQRPQLVASAANQALVQHFQTANMPSDEQLKQRYITRKMKRIYLYEAENKGVDIKAKLEGILADIKAGKLTFEQAMNQYTNEKAAAGKQKSENTFELEGLTLAVDPEYAPLQPLKIGETSGVLQFRDGVGAFKYLSDISALPADFEKKKEDLRKEFAQTRAASIMQAELSKVRNEGVVKWEDPGFHALYDYFQAQFDNTKMPKGPAEQKAFYGDIVKRAREALTGSSPRAAAFALYGASSELYNRMTDAEKKAAADERIDVLNTILAYTDAVLLRLELVDLLAAKGDKEGVGSNLLAAANANQNFKEVGQKDFSDINAKIDSLKQKKLLDPEAEKKVTEAQTAWRTQKLEQEKYEEEIRKQNEAAQKQAQEAQKKAEEEAKKKEKEAAKNPPKPDNTSKPAEAKNPPATSGGGQGNPLSPNDNN